MIQSLLKSSGIYFTGLLGAKAATVALFIVLARLLGPFEFGQYVFFITVLQLITVLSDTGLIQWYQKEAHSKTVRDLMHTVIPVRTTTLAVSLVLTWVIVSSTGIFPDGAGVLLLAAMIPEAYLSVIDGYYFHAGRSLLIALKTLIRTVLVFAGVLVLGSGTGYHGVIYVYLASSIISLIWYVPWQHLRELTFPSFASQLSTVKSSMKYAYLIVTSFAYSRGDSFVIKAVINDAALGIYGAAYRYLESLSLLPTALSHNLFPVSSREGAVSLKQLSKITMTMLGAGMLVAVAMWAGADLLINALVGAAYSDAVPVLRVFSIVVVLFFVSSPLSTVVQSSSIINRFLPWGVANTVANIALNIVLVPSIGIIGAAYSMLITEVTGLIINLWFVRKVYA